MGLSGRANPGAVVALAVIHHIVIGRNVPLDMATQWLVVMAPQEIIEFPHKGDPMVQTLLAQREDIFPPLRKTTTLPCCSGNAPGLSNKSTFCRPTGSLGTSVFDRIHVSNSLPICSPRSLHTGSRGQSDCSNFSVICTCAPPICKQQSALGKK